MSRTATLLGFSAQQFPMCTKSGPPPKQWWFVPFKMRQDDVFFHEHGLNSITAYWTTVIHMSLTLFNVTAIGLGYYMIL
jgi:hypothetical protein